MTRFICNKLARDNIVEVCEKNDVGLAYTILDDVEYKKELIKKLVEEADEVATAQNHDELIEELADVQEVLDALLVAYRLSKDRLRTVQDEKRERRGGFKKKIFVSEFIADEDSPYGRYFLSQPDRYKRIKE